MKRVLIVYHSQQFGNTKMLAEALAEGVRQAGAQFELINTTEQRVTLDNFLNADAVGIGTPDYFSYLAGTIKTFFDDLYLWDQAGKPVKGKSAVCSFHMEVGVKRSNLSNLWLAVSSSRWARRSRPSAPSAVRLEKGASPLAKNSCSNLRKELPENKPYLF